MGADRASRLSISGPMVGNEPSLIAQAEAERGPNTILLSFIADLSRLLTADADLDSLLERSLSGLVAALQGAACASVYLKPDDGDHLTLAAQCHQCAADGVFRKPRADLAAQVVEYVKPITVMVRHAPEEPFSPVLGLPISGADRALGALIVEADACIYDGGDSALLNLVAAQLALVVENRRLQRQLVALGIQQAPPDERFAY